MTETSRREAIRLAAAAAAAGLSPRMASATDIFSATERETLAAVADTLVPGAAAGGVVDFVAAMLASDTPDLCYTYMSLPMPPRAFYHATLAAFSGFAALPASERQAAIADLLAPKPH